MSVIRIVAFLLALMIGGGVVYIAATPWQQSPIKQLVATDPPIERETATASDAPPSASPSAPAAREETAALLEDLSATLAPSAPPAGDEPDELGFDIVRVEPSGEAVIAGKAPPGATVELLRDGEPHDQAVADADGNFVMTPPRFPAGNHALTLRADAPDGDQITSKGSVAVALPPAERERSTVALAEPGQPSVVLSEPAEAPEPAKLTEPTEPATRAVPEPVRPGVAFDSVELGPGGRLHVSGRAAPGATVRLYLNETYLADATAAGNGRFTFTITGGVRPGDYRVRLDEIDPETGTVRTRAEVPFTAPAAVAEAAGEDTPVRRSESASPPQPTGPARVAEQQPVAGQTSSAEPTSVAQQEPAVGQTSTGEEQTSVAEQKPAAGQEPEAGQTPPAVAVEEASAPTQDLDPRSSVVVAPITSMIVSRGDNLWRISRSNYGRGIRYTWIYEANRDQIRDPNLIYPGQILVIPDQAQ